MTFNVENSENSDVSQNFRGKYQCTVRTVTLNESFEQSQQDETETEVQKDVRPSEIGRETENSEVQSKTENAEIRRELERHGSNLLNFPKLSDKSFNLKLNDLV